MDLHTLHLWMSNTGLLLLIVNFFICVVCRAKLPAYFNWFALFFGVGVVLRIVALVLWIQQMNNMQWLHVYTLLEFICLSFFYGGVLTERKGKYFYHFVAGGAGLVILNSLFIQPLDTFNSIAKAFTQLSYIAYVLWWIYMVLKPEHKVVKYINAAIVVYYSGSLFIFMFPHILTYLYTDHVYDKYIWIVNVVLDLVFQLTILYGLWKTVLRPTKSLS